MKSDSKKCDSCGANNSYASTYYDQNTVSHRTERVRATICRKCCHIIRREIIARSTR